MTDTLFDFNNPNLLLKKHEVESSKFQVHRQSGTIQNSVKHSVIHTASPAASLHHTVIGASPHPVKARADEGEFYMIGFVSVPANWIDHIDMDFATTWDVTFVGPSGMIQRLPASLLDVEELLGADRVYIGFDWLWLGGDKSGLKPVQPSHDRIKSGLIKFINALRQRVEPKWKPHDSE